jgi:hypothetical protein
VIPYCYTFSVYPQPYSNERSRRSSRAREVQPSLLELGFFNPPQHLFILPKLDGWKMEQASRSPPAAAPPALVEQPPKTQCFLLTLICVNVLALVSSILVAGWIIYAEEDDPLERPGAASAYLIWNLSTTTIWLVDTSHRVISVYRHSIYDNNNNNNNNSTSINEDDDDAKNDLGSRTNYMTTRDNLKTFFSDRSSRLLIIELSLAIFFTTDSIDLLSEWRLDKEDIEADLLEVSMEVVSYAYISAVTILELKQVGRQVQQHILIIRDQYEQIPESAVV